MPGTKLIVLRGPSAAGKSTVARKLFAATARPTVLIEQDYYRFSFKPPGQRGTIQDMILHNALTALRDGYDVLLEGILSVKAYGGVFTALLREHPEDNYFFYFDISLEETVRRHQTRQTANLFSDDDMRQWYRDGDITGYDCENIISEDSDAERTVAKIRNAAGI